MPQNLELPEVRTMSITEKQQALNTCSRADADKLLAWLEATGRRWLVFDARHLVNALAWPTEVQDLQHHIARYREYRAGLLRKDPETGCTFGHGETLEVEELDRLIRYLISQISERDPSWSLESNPR
jgi:hypothetical protein